MDAKESSFIAVPFGCSLPMFCPVCKAPVEKVFKIKAWEGIPFAVTFSITVPVPYCHNHYKALKSLLMRERLAIAGAVIFPFAAMLPALADLSLLWLFYPGCVGSFILSVRAFQYARRLKAARAVQIRTMGSGPYFAVSGSGPEWHQKLSEMAEQYKKTHELKTPPVRIGV